LRKKGLTTLALKTWNLTAIQHTALAALYNQTLREQGILKSPSKLYPSLAISESDLLMLKTEAAVHRAVDAIANICS
jgi:glutamate-1-semialdehyde 2,1-aminomutase